MHGTRRCVKKVSNKQTEVVGGRGQLGGRLRAGGSWRGQARQAMRFLFIAQASLLARTANKESPGNHFDGFILSVASFKAFKDAKWVLKMSQHRLPSKLDKYFCPEGR